MEYEKREKSNVELLYELIMREWPELLQVFCAFLEVCLKNQKCSTEELPFEYGYIIPDDKSCSE